MRVTDHHIILLWASPNCFHDAHPRPGGRRCRILGVCGLVRTGVVRRGYRVVIVIVDTFLIRSDILIRGEGVSTGNYSIQGLFIHSVA